ncbi:lectin 6-like [Tripterygium wilfordii]|uniref:lectin 6-like n=1 Tax=Tripterygium wilfordii TaxID=458696 RepID=UPI0018F7E6D5|nr:lectin 6-like [Tripterygium wilfordii]
MFLLLLLIANFLNQAYSTNYGPSPAPTPAIPPLPFSSELIFPKFDSDACSASSPLTCTGAVTASDHGYLSLTPEPQPNSLLNHNQVGRVLYKYPLVAWPAIISTTFTFRITVSPSSPGYGDGITFVMAPDGGPSPPYSYGSFLGLMNRSTIGRRNLRQLAVEFDTYKNDFDIDGNHFAIDTISVEQSIISRSLNDTGINLKSGRDIKVRIDYNGWTKEFEISVGYGSDSLVKFSTFLMDISYVVPKSVYVGFTASTGAFTESHKLLSWEFLTRHASLKEVLINLSIKDLVHDLRCGSSDRDFLTGDLEVLLLHVHAAPYNPTMVSSRIQQADFSIPESPPSLASNLNCARCEYQRPVP